MLYVYCHEYQVFRYQRERKKDRSGRHLVTKIAASVLTIEVKFRHAVDMHGELGVALDWRSSEKWCSAGISYGVRHTYIYNNGRQFSALPRLYNTVARLIYVRGESSRVATSLKKTFRYRVSARRYFYSAAHTRVSLSRKCFSAAQLRHAKQAQMSTAHIVLTRSRARPPL